MLARYFDDHQKLLGHSVVTTTMRNGGLKDFIESNGMKMYETPVGDKYVVEKILELRSGASKEMCGLGGEQAGHIVIIDDDHTTGDGIRTALFVMRALQEYEDQSMAEFAAGIGKTPQIIASAYVGYETHLERALLDEMEAQILNDAPGITRVNLRYSGTEPQFRVMMESNGQVSEEKLATIAFSVCKKVQHFGGFDNGEIDVINCTRGGVFLASEFQS
jgi:phosphoglucosamine mutase